MIDSAEMVAEFTLGRTRDDLESDAMFRLALTKLIEIIGEAAKQVTQNAQDESPDIPWSAVARMRDRLVHHYFDVNLDILWQTVTEDVPKLHSELVGIGLTTESTEQA